MVDSEEGSDRTNQSSANLGQQSLFFASAWQGHWYPFLPAHLEKGGSLPKNLCWLSLPLFKLGGVDHSGPHVTVTITRSFFTSSPRNTNWCKERKRLLDLISLQSCLADQRVGQTVHRSEKEWNTWTRESVLLLPVLLLSQDLHGSNCLSTSWPMHLFRCSKVENTTKSYSNPDVSHFRGKKLDDSIPHANFFSSSKNCGTGACLNAEMNDEVR